MKALQGSQFHRFRNYILIIHEYDIDYYNESGRAVLEEQKIKKREIKKSLRRLPKFQATEAKN